MSILYRRGLFHDSRGQKVELKEISGKPRQQKKTVLFNLVRSLQSLVNISLPQICLSHWWREHCPRHWRLCIRLLLQGRCREVRVHRKGGDSAQSEHQQKPSQLRQISQRWWGESKLCSFVALKVGDEVKDSDAADVSFSVYLCHKETVKINKCPCCGCLELCLYGVSNTIISTNQCTSLAVCLSWSTLLLILKVYLVVGGWTSPGWTDSTETLVEGGSAWTLHTGSLPDGGFGDCGILYYNNVLYLFGGEESPPSGGYRDRQGRVKYCRGSLYWWCRR